MRLTEQLYNAVNEAITAFNENDDKYFSDMDAIESTRGSAFHRNKSAELKETRDNGFKEISGKYSKQVREILGAMDSKIKGQRNQGYQAPSEDAVRILQVLKMMQDPTETDYIRVASSMDGNPLAISALTDIARQNGKHYTFEEYCSELPSQLSEGAIRNIAKSCMHIVEQGTKTRTLSAEDRFHKEMYGADTKGQEKPVRSRIEPYKSATAMISRLGSPWGQGMSEADTKRFMTMIDAEGGE